MPSWIFSSMVGVRPGLKQAVAHFFQFPVGRHKKLEYVGGFPVNFQRHFHHASQPIELFQQGVVVLPHEVAQFLFAVGYRAENDGQNRLPIRQVA